MTDEGSKAAVADKRSALIQDAFAVLRGNDLGASTKPGPSLYPHQWSWDSAFIAIGLSYENADRALKELETLFAAQWSDGRVPHIVFNPKSSDYFPGPDRWDCSSLSKAAPSVPATSGIVQPPVHALALLRVWEIQSKNQSTLKSRFQQLFPKVMAWHRYLATARDPEKMGLITIYHPWESGMDNSPRWDEPLAKIVVGKVPPYERRDIKHVADPSERPTKSEYDRFLWLVECLKKAKYDDDEIYKHHPFLVKDAFASAIFVLASRALGTLAEQLDRPDAERKEIREWEERSRSGIMEHAWDRDHKLALDLEVNAGCSRIAVSTVAGLAPVLMPDLDKSILQIVAERLQGHDFAGNADSKYAVVPSTTPGTKGYHPRAYWRGPSWPVVDWLLWFGLKQNGCATNAEKLRAANLALLEQPNAHFGEYFETKTGTQLGSPNQSWTAAVLIDWLS